MVVLALLTLFIGFQLTSQGPVVEATHPEADRILDIRAVNGSPVYTVRLYSRLLPVYNGTVYGQDYENIEGPKVMNGSLVFIASDGEAEFIVHDGKRLTEDYQDIHELVVVDGGIAFRGSEGEKDFVVVDGEKRYYPSVQDLISVNGTPAYTVDQESEPYGGDTLVYRGEKISISSSNSDSLFEFKGELGYIDAENGLEKLVVGNRTVQNYDIIYDIRIENDNLLVDAEINDSEGVYSNGELLEGCRSARDAALIDGKLACTAESDNGTFLLYNGSKIDSRYGNIVEPVDINGSLGYVVRNGYLWFVVVDGEIISDHYDLIYGMASLDGEPVYTAVKDYHYYLVEGDERTPYRYQGVQYHGDSRGGEPLYWIRDSRMHLVKDGEIVENASYIEEVVVHNDTLLYRYWDGDEYRFSAGNISVEQGKVQDYVSQDGRLAYTVAEGDQEFLFFNGSRIEGFERIFDLKLMDGKPVFRGFRDGKLYVYTQGEVLGPFTDLSSIKEYDGRPLFYAALENGSVIRYHGTEQVTDDFEPDTTAYDVVSTGGAGTDEKVVFNGTETPIFDAIYDVELIDGTLAFTATRHNEDVDKHWLLYFDGETYGPYKYVSGFAWSNGSLFYAADTGEAWKIFRIDR